VRRYNGPAGAGDAASSLEVSPDGSTVFVAGASTGSTGSSDYAYASSTGSKTWVSRYDDPVNGNDQPLSMGVSPDGTKVFVTGYGPGSTSRDDYATLAYDGSDRGQGVGEALQRPGQPRGSGHISGRQYDAAWVYVTGTSREANRRFAFATVAYSTT
jgi:hypothetical protein